MEIEENPGSRQDICVIWSTAPPDQSATLAKSLLDQHLAACVNITPVRSLYWWKDGFCDDEEHQLIIKTRRELAEAAIQAIKAEHPYDVPEIIVLPVTAGYGPYLAWVHEQTGAP